jgi:hypothetical protein
LSYHLAASCLSEDFSSSYRYLPIGTTRVQPPGGFAVCISVRTTYGDETSFEIEPR